MQLVIMKMCNEKYRPSEATIKKNRFQYEIYFTCKMGIRQKICFFCLSFHHILTKNMQKQESKFFYQRLDCKAPECWSKQTTQMCYFYSSTYLNVEEQIILSEDKNPKILLSTSVSLSLLLFFFLFLSLFTHAISILHT